MTITYLNQVAVINALGAEPKAILHHLLNHHQQGMVPYDGLFSGHSTLVGQVKSSLSNIPHSLKQFDCRNNRLLASAYDQLAPEVAKLKQRYGAQRIGVVLGTSTSGIASGEHAIKQFLQHKTFPENFHYLQQEAGSCAEFLAQYAGVHGVRYTISTACSSSGKAIAAAQRLIQTDICDAVIVGGSDSLCELTLNGFDALQLVATEICNPFSVNRNGLNIGEGAALFILSKIPGEIALLGCGESTDGYHISAPDPSGQGAKRAIMSALRQAQIDLDDVGYINLHGTATIKNDAMESHLIAQLFPNTMCSSFKPLIGHTLGAASAQELALCYLLLSQPELPAQIWDKQWDNALPKINLIEKNTVWEKPIFMSNSFAFGGSNVSLIIGRAS